MNQPRGQVASVAKIHRCELFAALVEREELEIGGGVVEPGHSFRGCSPCSSGQYYLESAKVPTTVATLTAVIEPKDSQCENSVHHRC